MALYSYQAFSKDGKRISGYVDAPSTEAVKEQLVRQGLFPIKIEPARQEARKPWWQRLFAGKVTVKDKILFTRQLAVLLRSGVPLLQALELLSEQFEGSLQSMLISIKDEVKGGSSFADALSKYPAVFDTIYVQLVKAGEASGKLEVILERLMSFLERREEIQKKVKGALRYPLIQLGIALLVVAALMVGVVPTMAGVFKAQKQDLPFVTKLLVGISDIFVHYWLFVLIGIIIIGVAFRFWKASPGGAKTLDRIKLKLPLVGYFTRMGAIVQFCYTLGILLEGGVNLAQALDIVCNIVNNRILVDVLKEARDKIIKQGKIAQYLQQTNMFPPIAIYMINTGEQSGQLDKMLLTVAQNYEEDLGEFADTLTDSLGPILLVFMALIIGFIIFAIMAPIFKMMQSAQQMIGRF
jgi:type II secretory pathway component PulF